MVTGDRAKDGFQQFLCIADRQALGGHVGDAPVWMQRYLRQIVLQISEPYPSCPRSFDMGAVVVATLRLPQ